MYSFREHLTRKNISPHTAIIIGTFTCIFIPVIPILIFKLGFIVYALMFTGMILSFFAFHLNYFIFVNQFIIKRKRIFLYILANYLLSVLIATILWIISTQFHNQDGSLIITNPVTWILIDNAPFTFLIAVFAIAVKMTVEWFRTKNRQLELEKIANQAELQNLKNQLNPHFVFNSLNNIYALIDLDKEKAQNALLELSKLLRYVLYDNKNEKTLLAKELAFTNSYIDLMKLRLADNTSVYVKITNNPEDYLIAPLLFATLIENAFKHGVSQEEKSFIDITIERDGSHIKCEVRNSYFPKKENDYSGSGIGIANLCKRLELIYPDKHTYTTNIIDNTYIAILTIELE